MSLDIDVSDHHHMKVRFILDNAHSPGQASVVGSFNGWTPGLDSLENDHDGTRSVVIGLSYGERHVFRYLGPGDEWFDDPDADEITVEGSVLQRDVPTAGDVPSDAP